MDEIRIEELEIFAHHGVFQDEKNNGQIFYVNAILYLDLYPAGCTDDLTLSVHYGNVSLFIKDWLTEHTYDLLEKACETTAKEVLLAFDLIKKIKLEIRKPNAPIPMNFKSVSVCMERGWHKVYLSFGSNMGESKEIITDAIDKLSKDRENRMGKISDFIVTKPYGGVEQDDFLNGALEMETLYSPNELLARLHEIEKEAGRKRILHWGPRTLDLDILFYDKLIYEDEELIIPHIDLQNRDFVLTPMEQIAPWFRHPITGKTITEMKKQLMEEQI